jgi:hypothetical protein
MTGSPAVSRDTTRLVAFSDVMFDHIRAADRVMLLLNTLLLMVVALPRSPRPSSPTRCAAGTASEPPSRSTASRST